jgi:hypothetical protein
MDGDPDEIVAALRASGQAAKDTRVALSRKMLRMNHVDGSVSLDQVAELVDYVNDRMVLIEGLWSSTMRAVELRNCEEPDHAHASTAPSVQLEGPQFPYGDEMLFRMIFWLMVIGTDNQMERFGWFTAALHLEWGFKKYSPMVYYALCWMWYLYRGFNGTFD